jgi:hypothetical protein
MNPGNPLFSAPASWIDAWINHRNNAYKFLKPTIPTKSLSINPTYFFFYMNLLLVCHVTGTCQLQLMSLIFLLQLLAFACFLLVLSLIWVRHICKRFYRGWMVWSTILNWGVVPLILTTLIWNHHSLKVHMLSPAECNSYHACTCTLLARHHNNV